MAWHERVLKILRAMVVGILILLLWLIFCSHQVKDSVTPGKSQFKAYWALCRGSRYFPAWCSQEGSYVRWGKDFTKHFWFIFCFKHLLCDRLRDAPSCSVPDAIKKVAFDSDLYFFSTNLASTLCLGKGWVHWMILGGLSSSSNSRCWDWQPSCSSQHWQFN